jgi:hypothetical protein
MSMRRQGYEWAVADLGNLPPKRLADLERPQSVFFSGIGDATLKNRQRTSSDEFMVIHYFGSTPGIYGVGADWVPGGYVNFTLGTSGFFEQPDGRTGVGVSGDAQPYPVTIESSPVFVGAWHIEIPPDTDWDFTYFLANAMVRTIDLFPLSPQTTWMGTLFTGPY